MGVHFYTEIKAGNSTRWGVTSLPVTPGSAYKHLAGKLVTTWAWTQWDTRPCLVVHHYKGEGKADGQMSGRHWDSLPSVRPEDHDIYKQCCVCLCVCYIYMSQGALGLFGFPNNLIANA